MTARVIEYRCSGVGHVAYLRVTTLQPDPDRWQGSACGYCLRDGGSGDSVLERVRR